MRIHFLLPGLIFTILPVPGAIAAESPRIWKSKAGSELVATVVNWSDYDVTLKKEDGSSVVVPLDQISALDVRYLHKKPSLKVEKKPEKLPWVTVKAVAKSRSKNTFYDISGKRYDRRSIKMMVDIDNNSDETLEVDVIWMFFADGISSRIKLKSAEHYYPFDVESTRMTLQPRSEVTFETDEAVKTAMGYGQSYKGGSKVKGFVVQVYWKDWLLNGFASAGILNDIAEDPDLRKSLQSGKKQ